MSLAFDEYGRPFLIIKEQDSKSRLTGIEALKSHISAARAVADVMKTSLGPAGMDKILVNPDGNVTITNDGATILKDMHVEHEIARLLVELSQSQDHEIGDGTTSVVVLAGALLEGAETLLDKGIHPLKISDGYEKACKAAIGNLSNLATSSKSGSGLTTRENLIKAASTSLNSKVISKYRRKFAELAVDSVLQIYDKEFNDVNIDMIKVTGKVGKDLEDSFLINGLLLDKEFSHAQMPKVIENAKIAILNCAFEPPRPKTKHKLDILSGEDLKKLKEYESNIFLSMIENLKKSQASLVICQWGFDDEANYLLLKNELPAIRWVMGGDIENVAKATKGNIISRFEDLNESKLGYAKYVNEHSFGTSKENYITIEGCSDNRIVTVLLFAGNEMILEEAKRSFHDAVCVVKNLLINEATLPGGGATEVSNSIMLTNNATSLGSSESLAFTAFAKALLRIPECLVLNAGGNPLEVIPAIKSKQLSTGNSNYGFNCLSSKVTDMSEDSVIEPLNSKKHIITLASQLVRMILKIDDVIHCKQSS